jgi:hypothetical protein
VEINCLIRDAVLELYCYLCNLDLSKVNFIFDVVFELSTEDLVCLPILSFGNSHVHGSPLQVHGIVLRAKPSLFAGHERVGYFWTANQTTAREILEGLGEPRGIRLV